MGHTRKVFFLATLLVMSYLPLVSATEGRAFSCETTDMSSIPDPISIEDQECEKIALGILDPGTIVEFDVTGDVNFDFLVFRDTGLPAYQNEQSYRSSANWADETVFEDMVGSARWHWTVPTDESAKNWYIVLDNMDHAEDEGQGAQGGSLLQVSLDISFPSSSYWKKIDSFVDLEINSHTKLIDENQLILDEGTQVSISAIPLSGNPDIFLLTENQRTSYLDGNAPEFRITGADLLQVTTEGSVVWTVDSTYANQPLYLYADNKAGPTGGGDGLTPGRFTVMVTLLPVLDATITTDAASSVDVGEIVTFSANSTPNLSNQVDTNAYEWDLDGDGNFESTGSFAEAYWTSVGTFPATLRVNGVDGRSHTSSISIDVDDQTNPTVVVYGGNNLVRGLYDPINLESFSQDNFGIDKEEWYVDGDLIQSDMGTENTFNHSFSTLGDHTVELRVYDSANLSSSVSINVTVRDLTPPYLPDPILGPTEVTAGVSNTWRLNATDSDCDCNITWSWDFDRSADSDGDGDTRNDVQATGDLVTWTFEESGDYEITCTVTNEQGLTKTEELNVHVKENPTSASSWSTGLPYILPIGAIIGAIVGGVFFVRWMMQRRAHDEMMALESERIAAEEAETASEPNHEEQLTMFQNRGGATSGFQRSGGDEMAQIAGVGAGYGAQQPQVTTRQSSVDDAALLSAFEEPETKPVSGPQPEPKSEPAPVVTPTQRSNVLSSGIELPNVMKESANLPPTVATPEPEPLVEEPTPPVNQTTEVVGTCGDCGQQYAVDMPIGIEQAQIDCPHCGNRSTIRR